MGIQEVTNKKELIGKLTTARTGVLLKMPFYGTLLMNLKYGLANCGTACTDMKRILWDPEFLSRISIEEVQFVMLHEVLHCVLNHVNRGKGKISKLYNIAADIVVNSMIMQTYGADEFMVDGSFAMHLAPDGKEGYEYTADEIYDMLYKEYEELLDDVRKLSLSLDTDYDGEIDNHDIWDVLPVVPELSDEWKNIVKEAAQYSGLKNQVPPFIRALLDSDEYKSIIDWRYLLHDFIQLVADSYDFTFTPADRRYSYSDVILPSFHEIEEERIHNLWLLADTSGSVDDGTLTQVFQEIKAVTEQFASIEAKFSWFDTEVSEPVKFSSTDDLRNVKLSGGGGTSFHCIFDYLKDHMKEEPPKAIVIMTDGYAFYPKEAAALGIPVLWILIDNERDAPWGKSVHIQLASQNEL